jgi:Zn-dependent membrane protease YugP
MVVTNSNFYDYLALNRRMYGYFGAYNIKSIVFLAIALHSTEFLFTLAAIAVSFCCSRKAMSVVEFQAWGIQN